MPKKTHSHPQSAVRAPAVKDFASRILAWNRCAQEMYGYTEEGALQLDAGALIPEQARKGI